MTKFLENKAIRGLVALVVAVLLAAALIPHFQPAYGTDAAPDAAAPTFDAVVEEGAEEAPVEDADAGDAEDMPSENEAGGEDADLEGADGADDSRAPEGAASPGAPDGAAVAGLADGADTSDAPDAPASGDAASDAAPEAQAAGDRANVDGLHIRAGETLAENLSYSGNRAYTLTVDGTLRGRIQVSGGATLTLRGSGAIEAREAGSIIHVAGGRSQLVLDGPTVRGATQGTLLHHHAVFVKDRSFRAGGGILVERGSDGSPASLHFKSGAVTNNKAQVGGGIFIDRDCGFTMEGGAVEGNTATTHEGGGIYLAGHQDHALNPKARLDGGTIAGNQTQTTTDWGGGGIFIESKGHLRLASVLITDNHAQGLGGGVSGCPHAVIGIGEITGGAALYGNTAAKATRPQNSALYNNNGAGDHVAYDKDRAGFTAAKAQDFYCTLGSVVFGQDTFETGSSVAWTGRKADAQGRGEDVAIARGQYLAVERASLGLTAVPPTGDVAGRAVTITGNTSSTHGGGIGCNGTMSIGDLPTGDAYGTFAFSFDKKLANSLGEPLPLEGRQFSFALHSDKNGEPLDVQANDDTGTVTFTLGRSHYESIGDNETKTLTFYLRETGSYGAIAVDPDWHTVQIAVRKQVTTGYVDSTRVTFYAPVVEEVRIDGAAVTDGEPFAVTNTLPLEGSWTPTAKKFFHGGQGAAGAYSFELVEIEEPRGGLAQITPLEGGEVRTAANGDFTGEDGSAEVSFDAITYTEPGEHWYCVRETNGNDPVVYVVKVAVAGNNAGTEGASSTALAARVAEILYADGLGDGQFEPLGVDEPLTFHNNAEGAFALSGYAVSAYTGAPLAQKCLVDPKIIKRLEGRTLTPGEFRFQLIEVADYADTTGEVISETSNDADGMVDFDAAANKADPGWEPSCLLFTQPGTYKYRVIEDPRQGADPSVDYSNEVITFTVTVELDPDSGILAATDMYYGYLNEAGENVRYKEQYVGWQDKDPAWVPSVGDFADYDPSWHPTMTNRAKPQDLVVRKTSALTGEALEGATYGLYLVNHGGEADLRLAGATSDADGFVYFEDVGLKVGNLYYFLEEAAPAGHTVSAVRSAYFYLVPDASAGNGYAMRYTDNKFALEEAGDELVSAHDRDGGSGGSGADPAPEPQPTLGKDGALLYVYEANGGVQDEATHVEFTKLDTRTHEWVEGAKLSIMEKETGRVVSAWTSGAAPQVLQQVLNVGTVYVLREDEAPEGYDTADDVEFRIDSYGAVEVLSGTENGNAELSGSTLALYDTRLPVEEVATETRETTREVPRDRTQKLARTGDDLPLLAVGLLTLGALTALVLAARRTRKGKHELK